MCLTVNSNDPNVQKGNLVPYRDKEGKTVYGFRHDKGGMSGDIMRKFIANGSLTPISGSVASSNLNPLYPTMKKALGSDAGIPAKGTYRPGLYNNVKSQ